MANMTITISEAAYKRLKRLKGVRDSFTDVIMRELPDPLDTAGEILDHFEEHGVPKANPKLRKAMLQGRGRR